MPSLFLRFKNYRIIGGRAEDHRRIKGGRSDFILSVFCYFADVDNICFYGIKKYQENVCKIQIKIISLHSGIGDWVIGDGSCPSLPTQEDLEGLNRESVVIPL